MTKRSMILCQLIIVVIMTSLILLNINPASATAIFSIVKSGTNNNSVTVNPGGTFSADVKVTGLTAQGATQANLDSFTYRIQFPNENFTLNTNNFSSPFDNTLAPAGFNGSVPWSGLPVKITNSVDAGSAGATNLWADLYRTTASVSGTPASGSTILLETLKLKAPTTIGEYSVNLYVLEAADKNGAFHSITVKSPLIVKIISTKPPCEGDFDKDGDVDGSDLAVFVADFGRTNCRTGPPCEGDFDNDGDVDGSDLAVFAADFGRTDCPVP